MATATQRRKKADRRRAHAERRDERTGQKFASQQDRRRYLARLGRPVEFDARPRRFSPVTGAERVRFLSEPPNFGLPEQPEPGIITEEEGKKFWSRNGSSRARCSVCGKKEKTTKAGKIGKHGDCAGAGKEPADG